jgi:hypothetical protein
MALPGSRGGPATKDQAVELAERYATILRLRLKHGMTWRQISAAVGYHPKTCAAIYYKERGTEAGPLTIEAHQAQILAELEHLNDVLDPWLYRADEVDPVPTVPLPPQEVINTKLELLKMRIKLVGAEAPKLSATMMGGTFTHEVSGDPVELQSERAARRTEMLIELLKDNPLGQQEILDVDVTEIGIETGDSSVAPVGHDPRSNGHGPTTNGHAPPSGWATLAD